VADLVPLLHVGVHPSPVWSPFAGKKPAGRVEPARGWSGAPVFDDHKSIRSAPVFDDRSHHPSDALIFVVQATAGHCAWLGRPVAEADGLTSTEAGALLRLYGEERDRLTRSSKAALDAGVAERQVRLAEQWGQIIASVMSSVLDDLHLTPGQQKRAPAVVQRVLLAAEQSQQEAPTFS
jgi:hypothetical protein